jgi:ribonuclease HI
MSDPEAIEPERTVVTVRLRTVPGNLGGAWVVAYPEADGQCSVRSGLVEAQATAELTRAEAAVAALGCVLQLAPDLGLIDLDVPGGLELRRAFFEATRLIPAIRLANPVHAESYRDAAQEALSALLPPAPAPVTPLPDLRAAPARSLVIGVDASIAASGSVAGLGWVVATVDGDVLSCGQDTLTVSRRGDITFGELAAIRCGLDAARTRGFPNPDHGTVTVLSDSRSALSTLRKVRNGESVAGVPNDSIREAEAVLAKTGGYPVVFEWVKGHRGHRLNEAADRLAVMARRNEEFNVTRAIAHRMFADLRSELTGPLAA